MFLLSLIYKRNFFHNKNFHKQQLQAPNKISRRMNYPYSMWKMGNDMGYCKKK